jgi:hypothetical protein
VASLSRFPTEEDKKNAIDKVALTTVIFTLVVFKLAFNYSYSSTFLAALALGMGYVGFLGGQAGDTVLKVIQKVEYLNREIPYIKLKVSTLVIPVLLFILVWVIYDGKVELKDLLLGYVLGTIAILTPTKVYEDRSMKTMAYVLTEIFLSCIFYTTIFYSWPGLAIWTAISLGMLMLMEWMHGWISK